MLLSRASFTGDWSRANWKHLIISLLSEDWYKTDLKHLIIFIFSSGFFHATGTGQFNYRGLRKALLFSSGIVSTFDLVKSLKCMKLAYSQPWVVWPTTNAQNVVTSSYSSSGSLLLSLLSWVRNLPSLYNFHGHPRTSWSLFLPVWHPLNSHGISAVFFFFTLWHRCIPFWYLHNLRGLSKVKYLTIKQTGCKAK